MRLNLRIKAANEAVRAFTHEGPVVRVGRDPVCELCFEGAAAEGVSRQHARIDAQSEGAMLRDTGSSNGTILNGEPITIATPIRASDRIQLGYLGPAMVVAELELQTSGEESGARGEKAGARGEESGAGGDGIERVGVVDRSAAWHPWVKPAIAIAGALLLGLILAVVVGKFRGPRQIDEASDQINPDLGAASAPKPPPVYTASHAGAEPGGSGRPYRRE